MSSDIPCTEAGNGSPPVPMVHDGADNVMATVPRIVSKMEQTRGKYNLRKKVEKRIAGSAIPGKNIAKKIAHKAKVIVRRKRAMDKRERQLALRLLCQMASLGMTIRPNAPLAQEFISSATTLQRAYRKHLEAKRLRGMHVLVNDDAKLQIQAHHQYDELSSEGPDARISWITTSTSSDSESSSATSSESESDSGHSELSSEDESSELGDDDSMVGDSMPPDEPGIVGDSPSDEPMVCGGISEAMVNGSVSPESQNVTVSQHPSLNNVRASLNNLRASLTNLRRLRHACRAIGLSRKLIKHDSVEYGDESDIGLSVSFPCKEIGANRTFKNAAPYTGEKPTVSNDDEKAPSSSQLGSTQNASTGLIGISIASYKDISEAGSSKPQQACRAIGLSRKLVEQDPGEYGDESDLGLAVSVPSSEEIGVNKPFKNHAVPYTGEKPAATNDAEKATASSQLRISQNASVGLIGLNSTSCKDCEADSSSQPRAAEPKGTCEITEPQATAFGAYLASYKKSEASSAKPPITEPRVTVEHKAPLGSNISGGQAQDLDVLSAEATAAGRKAPSRNKSATRVNTAGGPQSTERQGTRRDCGQPLLMPLDDAPQDATVPLCLNGTSTEAKAVREKSSRNKSKTKLTKPMRSKSCYEYRNDSSSSAPGSKVVSAVLARDAVQSSGRMPAYLQGMPIGNGLSSSTQQLRRSQPAKMFHSDTGEHSSKIPVRGTPLAGLWRTGMGEPSPTLRAERMLPSRSGTGEPSSTQLRPERTLPSVSGTGEPSTTQLRPERTLPSDVSGTGEPSSTPRPETSLRSMSGITGEPSSSTPRPARKLPSSTSGITGEPSSSTPRPARKLPSMSGTMEPSSALRTESTLPSVSGSFPKLEKPSLPLESSLQSSQHWPTEGIASLIRTSLKECSAETLLTRHRDAHAKGPWMEAAVDKRVSRADEGNGDKWPWPWPSSSQPNNKLEHSERIPLQLSSINHRKGISKATSGDSENHNNSFAHLFQRANTSVRRPGRQNATAEMQGDEMRPQEGAYRKQPHRRGPQPVRTCPALVQ